MDYPLQAFDICGLGIWGFDYLRASKYAKTKDNAGKFMKLGHKRPKMFWYPRVTILQEWETRLFRL